MKEQDKGVLEFRIERDDCAALLRRMLHATRPGADIDKFMKSRLRERAEAYLKRHGLQGEIIRTM